MSDHQSQFICAGSDVDNKYCQRTSKKFYICKIPMSKNWYLMNRLSARQDIENKLCCMGTTTFFWQCAQEQHSRIFLKKKAMEKYQQNNVFGQFQQNQRF